MNYEERYKEALDLMKDCVPDENGLVHVHPEDIFPELRESEDDRIRKGIIRNLEYLADRAEGFVKDELKERIAWLEKQGEQKPVVIIPKFRVGDEIETENEESLTITRIDEEGYWSNDLFICGFDDSAEWELVEQKPEWSEEDENILQGIWDEILANKHNAKEYEWKTYDKFLAWLKSLKARYTWKPSEEQVRALHDMNLTGNISYAGQGQALIELYNDLKKL